MTIENPKKAISLDEYCQRHSNNSPSISDSEIGQEETEFTVTIPPFLKLGDEIEIDGSQFTDEEINAVIRAPIRTLPPNVRPAFTLKEYYSDDPLHAREKDWPLGIVGFDPLLPRPTRCAPVFNLQSNFNVPPPKSAKQHKYWMKNWKRLERIIFYDFRIYIQEINKAIFRELIKQKSMIDH